MPCSRARLAKPTMQWFPVLPPDQQQPYDPGPYHEDAAAPIQSQETVGNAEALAAQALLKRTRSLPADAIHQGSNSNNWAVDGTKTASGKAMMAGDPHLAQTLPSVWYEIAAKSPSYNFVGVSFPGLPAVPIGHNANIAWSETNVQNQATFFYKEKTSPQHPGAYYWDGAWRRMQQVHYSIPVKGEQPQALTVDLTVHGPIMEQAGQTLSVDWMGNLPSPDIDAILNLLKAKNFSQFRSALKDWHAPSQNFVYADKQGNIGMISAGYYPIIKHGDPWLPMSGTGSSDIVGTIPYKDIPQVYDPPTHIVFSANQREVGKNYPYYIGTTDDFFDNGYRADEIQQYLSSHSKLTMKDFAALQNDTQDYLAGEIVPKLLAALPKHGLTAQQQQARELLSSWNDNMAVNSAAASIWWTFWTQYLNDTFEPWWKADNVPVKLDPSGLAVDPNQSSLDEDLEAWTLHDPTNASFTLPNGTKRTAPQVMSQAFNQAVTSLAKQLGSNPTQWQWGKIHSRAFPSLTDIPVLGFGPKAAGGDEWTPDAADGGMEATTGPSWRMIVDWGTGAEGVYPGGQSENPMSPWYENQVSAWWNGQYYPIYMTQQAGNLPAKTSWSLKP